MHIHLKSHAFNLIFNHFSLLFSSLSFFLPPLSSFFFFLANNMQMPSTLEASILSCFSILSQYDSLEVRNSKRGEKEPQTCPETRLNKGMFLSLASCCQFRVGENLEVKCNLHSPSLIMLFDLTVINHQWQASNFLRWPEAYFIRIS